MNRRVVRTREPIVEIPASLRKIALCEVLFKEYVLPNRALTELTLKKLREYIGMDLTDRISIAKQSNILLAEMDPRERCIPIVSGARYGTASYRHASSHSNFVVV